MLLLITSYHILSSRLERKPFPFGNSKISCWAPDILSPLITPCHSLSRLITPYPLGWKENYFHLATLNKISSQAPDPSSHLITPYHCLSHIVTPYPTSWKQKHFDVGNLKISPDALDFLSHLNAPFHPLLHLTTPYPLGWKQKHLILATFKLVSRLQIFITSYQVLPLLITPYHPLSPKLERKPVSFGNFKISYQALGSLSPLITPCYSLSHLITPHPLGWRENHSMLATLKIVPRIQIFYHILSHLVTPYRTLSHLIP